MDEPFPGIYRIDGDLWTANAAPGETVYGEVTRTVDGTEYRRWDPHRSKAAAALTKGLRDFPVDTDSEVLYLGASTGTTVSHISDILQDGLVYAVEYAPQVARQLLDLARQRDNIAPLLGDARKPEEYAPFCSTVDIIYQDVTQQGQVRILAENADIYLRDGGHALLAVKARSIDSSADPWAASNSARSTTTTCSCCSNYPDSRITAANASRSCRTLPRSTHSSAPCSFPPRGPQITTSRSCPMTFSSATDRPYPVSMPPSAASSVPRTPSTSAGS
ncbi:MAG: fibrillarin-like rRNA/tRNA 2'-O-methyltransferase, partial [Candidatus Nanohaloarchaea archaeon]